MPGHYRRDGSKYPDGEKGLFEWAEDFGKERHIGDDYFPNDIRISTVWLGLDHSWGFSKRPLIFESMVFHGKNFNDLDCIRYSTEEEARLGHKMLVKKWKTYKTPDEVLNAKVK